MTDNGRGKTRRRDAGARVLKVLDLFTIEEPCWTVEMLMARLKLPHATVYRYVRVLVEAGFLTAAWRGSYVLGSRFIEFDRQIRLADPLLRVGPVIMAQNRQEVDGTQFLCTYYGEKILTVHQDGPDDDVDVTIPLERGRVWPQFRGSPAHVVLANLPTLRLKNIFLHNAQNIAAAGLGSSWAEFTRKLKDIRRQGYSLAMGLINVGASGVSAPIFGPKRSVIGAICLTRPHKELSPDEIDQLSGLAIKSAQQITSALARLGESAVTAPLRRREQRNAEAPKSPKKVRKD